MLLFSGTRSSSPTSASTRTSWCPRLRPRRVWAHTEKPASGGTSAHSSFYEWPGEDPCANTLPTLPMFLAYPWDVGLRSVCLNLLESSPSVYFICRALHSDAKIHSPQWFFFETHLFGRSIFAFSIMHQRCMHSKERTMLAFFDVGFLHNISNFTNLTKPPADFFLTGSFAFMIVVFYSQCVQSSHLGGFKNMSFIGILNVPSNSVLNLFPILLHIHSILIPRQPIL